MDHSVAERFFPVGGGVNGLGDGCDRSCDGVMSLFGLCGSATSGVDALHIQKFPVTMACGGLGEELATEAVAKCVFYICLVGGLSLQFGRCGKSMGGGRGGV